MKGYSGTEKSMKLTWYSSNGGGGYIKFMGVNKCSTHDEDMNTLVASIVDKAIKPGRSPRLRIFTDKTWIKSCRILTQKIRRLENTPT